jgi:AcrR family transcriptional regulator
MERLPLSAVLVPTKRRAKPGRPRDPALADRRREQILRAATRLFARDGFEATDLQNVADALKIGKGTIYRYFPTKRDLFQHAVDRVMIQMRLFIDATASQATDPLDQITGAIRAYLQFFHDHPQYVEILIQERAAFRDRRKPTYFKHRQANLGRWQAVYLSLIREGRIRQIPVDRITDVLGDLIYGTMFSNYVAGRTKNLVDQADDIADIAFNGLLTARERERQARPTTPRPAVMHAAVPENTL